MAQHPTNQDPHDFANLTDSLIPSNIYMSSWGQIDQQKTQDIQPFPFNMFTPSFGSLFPLSNNTGNPSGLSDADNHNPTAFNINSLQQMDGTSREQERGVGKTPPPSSQTNLAQTGAVTTPATQQIQASPDTSRSAISDNKDRLRPAREELATLKLKAKESVMAKHARSIRSTSNDSKSGNAGGHGPNLTENGGHSDVAQVGEMDLMNLSLPATMSVESVQQLKPPADIHLNAAKASSAELEDLLAEGRAAASMGVVKNNNVSNAVGQHGNHVDRKQHHKRDVSEAGEVRDDSSHREQELRAHQQPPLKIERFPTNGNDEVNTWLAMTGYYDKPYRDKVLNRRKRLEEIEAEKLKLLQEEQEDHRFRGQYHSSTPFHTPQRPTPTVATIHPPSSATKEDIGLRIRNSASKIRNTPEKTISTDDVPIKRRIEEEPSDTEAPHQTKAARTEVYHRTPPRSKHASPEKHQNRSVSPGKSRMQRTVPVSRKQSVHSVEAYDRWVPDLNRDRRGPLDRSLEEHGRRDDNRGRYDQRRDSGLSISHPPKPDFGAGRVRFFLLKSWNYENIATAQREGTWATQVKNEDTFVEAFKTCRHVIFFFSANHSKAFQGYARMQGLPGEKGVPQPSWVKNLHWPTTAPFRIRWIVKDETPYRAVGNLKNPLNENLAVFVGRDGQEIPEDLGKQLSEIIDEDTAYRAKLRR